jgi:hypothetical protein
VSAVCGEASTFGKVRHVRQDVELVHRMLEGGLIRNEVYTEECLRAAAQGSVDDSRLSIGCGGDWNGEWGGAGVPDMASGVRSLDASFRDKSIAVIELGAGAFSSIFHLFRSILDI